MRIAQALVLMLSCYAQSIPGLGSDPMKKGPLPPMVQVRTNPPRTEAAEAAHSRVLSELKDLIDVATALREQIEKDGPNVVHADAAAKLREMKKSLKAAESGIKPK